MFYCYFTPSKIFISVLAGGLSLESEFPDLYDSSKYSGHSQQWMVSILSWISNSSSSLSEPLEIIPSVPTIISITVMFHRFLVL